MTTPTRTAARFPTDYGQTPETLAEFQEWREVADRIASAKNYFLAATTDHGAPYLRPVDGVFIDDALCFGGSPATRWVRYLQQRPWVSVSLPDDDHAVILEGEAELVTDPDLPLSTDLAAANRAKYPQYFGDDEAVSSFHPFWCLRPARVYAWSLSNFPRQATRFDF